MKTNKQILNSREAAALIGVDVRTLRKWVESGEIIHKRLPGGVVRFDLDELMMWLESKTVAAAGVEHPASRRRRKQEEIMVEKANREAERILAEHYKNRKSKTAKRK